MRKNVQLNRETKFELKYFVITEGSLGPQETSGLHPQYLIAKPVLHPFLSDTLLMLLLRCDGYNSLEDFEGKIRRLYFWSCLYNIEQISKPSVGRIISLIEDRSRLRLVQNCTVRQINPE